MPRYKVLGVSDDESTCTRCGKSNLKRVVYLQDTVTGERVHYGVDCAADAMRIPAERVMARAKAADAEHRSTADREHFRRWLGANAPAVGAPTDQSGYDRASRVIARKNGYTGDLGDIEAIRRYVAALYTKRTGRKRP